jgi:hypothetical protein
MAFRDARHAPAAAGWCVARQMCVEPTLCSARLGRPLRIRASTCEHHLFSQGVRLVGHHQREAAVFPPYAVATAAAAFDTIAAVAAVAVVLAALAARTASQTSAAWLARRTPGPQAVPSPTGLCAGAPAGRPPDGVCTTQLLGTRVGGLRCDAQAGPCQASSRRSSCALATGLLLVLRVRVPAPPPAFGEDGK